MKFQPEEFLDRLNFAAGLAVTRNRIKGGQVGLAKALSKRSGESIGQSGVSKWISQGNRPSLEHIAALAHLAGVDPGWLAMGELSAAPAPDVYLRPAPEQAVVLRTRLPLKGVKGLEEADVKRKGKHA